MLRQIMILLSSENFKITMLLIFVAMPLMVIITIAFIRGYQDDKLKYKVKNAPFENQKILKKWKKEKKKNENR